MDNLKTAATNQFNISGKKRQMSETNNSSEDLNLYKKNCLSN